MERVLMIQLARLGDIVQSLPAFVGIRAAHPGAQVDMLCASVLTSVAERFPSLGRALGWDGARWCSWASRWADESQQVEQEAGAYLAQLVPGRYAMAYNLNQHQRAITAAYLCADRVQGAGAPGVLAERRHPWAEYLRVVAATRGDNRVHLADAFCGLCGVLPPSLPPRLEPAAEALPRDLCGIGESEGPWIALVVGAGDAERIVPEDVCRQWVETFLAAAPSGQVVLVGAGGEREVARRIQDDLSSLTLGRVWDTTGRLSLAQLSVCLQRCQWVLGGDTGPLHLGAALGTRAMGWFIGRARAHETGPYGPGHVVWQRQARTERMGTPHDAVPSEAGPLGAGANEQWPVGESVECLLTNSCGHAPSGWSLMHSRFDEWGTYYVERETDQAEAVSQRRRQWESLQRPIEVTS